MDLRNSCLVPRVLLHPRKPAVSHWLQTEPTNQREQGRATATVPMEAVVIATVSWAGYVNQMRKGMFVYTDHYGWALYRIRFYDNFIVNLAIWKSNSNSNIAYYEFCSSSFDPIFEIEINWTSPFIKNPKSSCNRQL